jgi:hypothetical protein
MKTSSCSLLCTVVHVAGEKPDMSGGECGTVESADEGSDDEDA